MFATGEFSTEEATAEFSTEEATGSMSMVSAFIEYAAFGVPLGGFGVVADDGAYYSFGVIREYQDVSV